MNHRTTIIRQAQPKDRDDILRLMQALAQFEGYGEQFVVTTADLDKRLFAEQSFSVLVAEVKQNIAGILVYYTLPFTYDLKPWWYIKELFVDAEYRVQGLGKQLMQTLAQHAVEQGCTKIRWDVLSSNKSAKAFYQSLGAQHEENWLLFSLTSDKISKLVSL